MTSNKQKTLTLIVGSGFFGEEWGTEFEYSFRNMSLTIIKTLPRRSCSLLDSFAEYWSAYMNACGFKELYDCFCESLKDET